MSNTLYNKGDIKEARKKALEAYALVKSIGFHSQVPALALVLMNIELKDKHYKQALDYHLLYVRSRDSLSNESQRKQALEKEFAYNLDKKESENQLLAQKNQIQLLKIRQDKYLLAGFGGLLVLIIVIANLLIRQNKLKTEKQSMLMEQKLISSQMNPHFIFNSLSSIQELIMKGENQEAEVYLSKFAKLIRGLLESNDKENLPIGEEILLLRTYLEMESRRFGKSFSYFIHVDQKIDKEHDSIPNMMVQPFVENAIWHGLLAKKGDRSVRISFDYDSDRTIRCTVDDNGVGRAAGMKRESTFKKKSLALSFVRQRLELIRSTTKLNCDVNIIDKTGAGGESLGTTVVVVLPLIKK